MPYLGIPESRFSPNLVSMLVTVAHIGSKAAKSGEKAPYAALTRLYLERMSAYHPNQTEVFASEAALLAWLGRPGARAGRTPIVPVLLDGSRGRALTSPEFAAWFGARRDQGAQHLLFAIGPADGWSQTSIDVARSSGGLVLSFGPITMAHDLARLVLAEQLYRACTILAGHPYHTGH
jgi:23S rRNA (pseudouridine1915-N3)-methyltransferase